MIISVAVNSRHGTDFNTSHSTEVIVDDEDQATTAGKQFWGLVLAFNRGLAEAAAEEDAAA